jgi:hypothetical protein
MLRRECSGGPMLPESTVQLVLEQTFAGAVAGA